MPTYIMNEGAVVPNSVYSGMNTVLNKKLGTSQVYKPQEWADLVKNLVPLPEKTASGSIAHFSDGADTVPLKSSKFYITPQQASGTPTPSDPLPISGWTGANVTQTGANLLDVSEGTIGLWIDSSGNETTALQGYVSEFIKTTGTTIKTNVFGQGDVSFFSCSICEYDKDKQFIRRDHHTTTALSSEISDTLSNTTAFVKFQIYLNGGMTQTALDNGDIMVSFDTATTFEAYNGTTYPVSWSEHGTIYGGYFKDGELWKTISTPIDLGSLSWGYYSSRFDAILGSSDDYQGYAEAICEIYKWNDVRYSSQLSNLEFHVYTSGANTRIAIRDDSYSDTTTFKTSVTGHKVSVTLATPVKVADIDPLELVSFLGVNNVWTDTGDSEVEYRADPTLATQ